MSVCVCVHMFVCRYLTQYDCVTFYNLVNSIRSATVFVVTHHSRAVELSCSDGCLLLQVHFVAGVFV